MSSSNNSTTSLAGPLDLVQPFSNMNISVSESQAPENEPLSILNSIDKRVITILLIGETGTGKTSFMSLLANLFRDKGPLELKEIHDKSRESGLSINQSQTTRATLYTITAVDGTRVQILDTPGLADTRGIEQDNKHKTEINNAIKQFVTSIDAVIIIANGTQQRLTAATEYTLNTITSMFPRSIVENIGFLFTNSQPLRWNFDLNSLPLQLRNSQYWLLENPLAMLKNFGKMKREQSMSPRHMKKQEGQLNAVYQEAVETTNEILEWLDKRTAQPTKEIDALYQISMRIEANLSAALAVLARLREERIQYERITHDLESRKRAKTGIENLIMQQTTPVWERTATTGHNTLCLATNCYSNCHFECQLDFLHDRAEIGRYCWIFKLQPSPRGASSLCRICGHRADQHSHFNELHSQKPREMEPETRRQLEQATSDEERLTAAKNLAQRTQNGIQGEMQRTCERIRSLVDDYNRKSLTSNFTGHIRATIKLLNLRGEDLSRQAGTDVELQLIDESIEKLEKKLKILTETKRSRMGYVVDWVRGWLRMTD